jgi:chorismate-pyruvate lyase
MSIDSVWTLERILGVFEKEINHLSNARKRGLTEKFSVTGQIECANTDALVVMLPEFFVRVCIRPCVGQTQECHVVFHRQVTSLSLVLTSLTV